MMKVTDSDDGVFLPELQKVQSLPLWAFANFGGRALYADLTNMAQISAGDRRTAPGTNLRLSPALRASSCPLTG